MRTLALFKPMDYSQLFIYTALVFLFSTRLLPDKGVCFCEFFPFFCTLFSLSFPCSSTLLKTVLKRIFKVYFLIFFLRQFNLVLPQRVFFVLASCYLRMMLTFIFLASQNILSRTVLKQYDSKWKRATYILLSNDHILVKKKKIDVC